MTEGIRARSDQDPHKRFPNGLKATLKAIRKFWNRRRKSEYRPGVGRPLEAFAEVFRETYNRVGGYYHEDERSVAAVISAVGRLEGSGEEHKSDISFWQIRSYAEFTELPTSLLVLFGQLTSYEAQGRTREEIRNFLSRCRYALDAIDRYMSDNNSKEFVFHQRLSKTESEMEYIALLAGLYEMSIAFGGWENRLRDPSRSRS